MPTRLGGESEPDLRDLTLQIATDPSLGSEGFGTSSQAIGAHPRPLVDETRGTGRTTRNLHEQLVETAQHDAVNYDDLQSV